jgi:hypothetical protein
MVSTREKWSQTFTIIYANILIDIKHRYSLDSGLFYPLRKRSFVLLDQDAQNSQGFFFQEDTDRKIQSPT